MRFPHLHVASSYSAHYGVAPPHELAQAAAADGARILACTDRDGLYGAVKHVAACRHHGLAPVLGVDLAVLAPAPARRGGGAGGRGDPPPRASGRVVVLAVGGTGGAGYAALCRLVSAAHRDHDRHGAHPVGVSPLLLARHVRRAAAGGAPGLIVALGPRSDVGGLLAGRHYAPARAALRGWQRLLPRRRDAQYRVG